MKAPQYSGARKGRGGPRRRSSRRLARPPLASRRGGRRRGQLLAQPLLERLQTRTGGRVKRQGQDLLVFFHLGEPRGDLMSDRAELLLQNVEDDLHLSAPRELFTDLLNEG